MFKLCLINAALGYIEKKKKKILGWVFSRVFKNAALAKRSLNFTKRSFRVDL